MKLNKLMFAVLGGLALALPAFAGTATAKNPKNPVIAPAPEEDLGLTLSVGYDSSYLFRGVDFGDNWISTALSLDIPLVDKVKATLDANFGSLADDSDNFIGNQSYQRLELGAGIAYDAGAAEIGFGYRWYHHMGDLDSAFEDGHEVGLTVASSVGPVNVGIGTYYDFAIDGWYLEAAANTEVKINDMFSIVPGANIGYAIDYSWHDRNFSGDNFTHVGVSIAFPVKLSSRATLTPYIAANFPLTALDNTNVDDDKLYGGVSLSVKF
ncbi:MAG: hypothetical protein K1X78_18385 [Verrucomicrobiaceae bacterium]|nr:hypothetical protein [Verrucomicrobiaceae bacterium]